jgi:hypothetical protein
MTVSSETVRSISTPDQLGSRLGTLDFVNGVPRSETVETVYDHLDFVHALNVYLNGFAGASTYALRTGFHEAGAADNQILTPLPHTEHRPTNRRRRGGSRRRGDDN